MGRLLRGSDAEGEVGQVHVMDILGTLDVYDKGRTVAAAKQIITKGKFSISDSDNSLL